MGSLRRSSGNAVQSSTGDTGKSLDLMGDLDYEYGLNGWESGSQSFPGGDASALLLDSSFEPAELAEPEAVSLEKLSPAERRANSNRLAQRRARARRKARTEGAEAQLAVSSAELQELLNKQKELEARNSLLEKIVQLGPAQQPQQQRQLPESLASRTTTVIRHSSVCFLGCTLPCLDPHYCRVLLISGRLVASRTCLDLQQDSLVTTKLSS